MKECFNLEVLTHYFNFWKAQYNDYDWYIFSVDNIMLLKYAVFFTNAIIYVEKTILLFNHCYGYIFIT